MNVELRQNRFKATVTRRADLFVHPHRPACRWRGSVLVDVGVNAVSTQTIRKRTYPVLMLRGVMAVAYKHFTAGTRVGCFTAGWGGGGSAVMRTEASSIDLLRALSATCELRPSPGGRSDVV